MTDISGSKVITCESFLIVGERERERAVGVSLLSSLGERAMSRFFFL